MWMEVCGSGWKCVRVDGGGWKWMEMRVNERGCVREESVE